MNLVSTKHNFVLDLLDDIVKHNPPLQTDLIICSTREEFLAEVLAQLDRHRAEHESSTSEQNVDEADQKTSPTSSHILLSPSLYLLSATITILRGYLSSYVPKPSEQGHPADVRSSRNDHIVIVNLLRLHHGSSEFTLQGLSQTFATAVSAAHRTNRSLKLVECKDIENLSDPSKGLALWQAEVPLLSGSIKIGEGGASWGRRTVSATRIASRWFRFERDNHRDVPEARRWERFRSGDEILLE
ncbi:hypothetical protein LTR67_000381 [Exophiala xenobiotica]